MLRSIIIFCALIIPTLSAVAQTTAADKILGIYYVSDDTSDEDCKVKIYKDNSGTYSGRIIWVKTPKNTDSWTFFEQMLTKCNVVVTPGVGFGPQGEGYVRMTAFGNRDNCVEAVKRISKIFG